MGDRLERLKQLHPEGQNKAGLRIVPIHHQDYRWLIKLAELVAGAKKFADEIDERDHHGHWVGGFCDNDEAECKCGVDKARAWLEQFSELMK